MPRQTWKTSSCEHSVQNTLSKEKYVAPWCFEDPCAEGSLMQIFLGSSGKFVMKGLLVACGAVGTPGEAALGDRPVSFLGRCRRRSRQAHGGSHEHETLGLTSKLSPQ